MPFLAPLLGLLGGKMGKFALYGLGVVALALGVWLWFREHDAAVRARLIAKQQAVIAAQQVANARKAVQAEQQVADAAVARATALAAAQMEIANAPAPPAICTAPVAVQRALGVLRQQP